MQKTQLKGFTIIEVVLVLAIAGLIFLMVFLAFPALQKNQRDAQRRQDASAFISQLQSYRTDHKGKLPANVQTDFVDIYLKDWKDPLTGAVYAKAADLNDAKTGDAGKWFYQPATLCPDTGGVAKANNAALTMRLESGFTCQDL